MTINEIFQALDPIPCFRAWLAEAQAQALPEPTAMTLATVSADGQPSARVVLFKDTAKGKSGREGFCLYTHYQSQKSLELAGNSGAALVFYWPQLNRQIRIEGKVEKLSELESDRYFQSRPRGSRIGAWASPQSHPIASRQELMDKVAEVEARFVGDEVPRPNDWGGWLLVPERIEFWQAGEFRLHDRAEFKMLNNGTWRVVRLAP